MPSAKPKCHQQSQDAISKAKLPSAKPKTAISKTKTAISKTKLQSAKPKLPSAKNKCHQQLSHQPTPRWKFVMHSLYHLNMLRTPRSNKVLSCLISYLQLSVPTALKSVGANEAKMARWYTTCAKLPSSQPLAPAPACCVHKSGRACNVD